MFKGMNRAALFGCACLLLSTTGCEAFDLGDAFRVGKKVVKVAKSYKKAMAAADLSPEQEHYVGRTVAAQILASYRPYDNKQANRYLNLLGQSLAKVSDRPETFKGYRFLILDTDEINSFAAPGGFIFISRGMIRCCESEDGLAAVLAHEIAHVVHKHGLLSIRSKRLTSVGLLLLGEATDQAKGDALKQLNTAFKGSIDDIASTLIKSKYSRATEVVADKTAVSILQRLGYAPGAFSSVLSTMKTKFKGDKRGFFKTHPDPDYRIRTITQATAKVPPLPPSAERKARFEKALKGI